MNTRRVLVVAAITVTISTWAIESWSYGITGFVEVRAVPSPLQQRAEPLQPVVTLQDSLFLVGSGRVLNNARAEYSADLTSGIVRARALADNGLDPFEFAGASVSVGWEDALFFTIPAGNYTDDITVTANGFIDFQASARGRAQTGGSADARLGNDRFRVGGFSLQANGGFEDFNVSTPFTLEQLLIPAGTFLNSPREIRVPIEAGFGRFQTIVIGTAGPPAVRGEAVGVFEGFGTLGITSLLFPDNVAFRSESGVFLTSPQPSPVPEPHSLYLLGLGILSIAAIRYTRRTRS